MAQALEFRVYDKQELVYEGEFTGTVELGRQSSGQEQLYSRTSDAGRWRLVIASSSEDSVSRKHVRLETLPEGTIRLTNLSKTSPVFLPDGSQLRPGATREAPLPVFLMIGQVTVRVQAADTENRPLQSLYQSTPPGKAHLPSTRFPARALPSNDSQSEELVLWLEAAMNVLQSATSSSDFFVHAAQAVVDIVGLDSGSILLWHQTGWRIEALRTAAHVGTRPDWHPSQEILTRVRSEKRTFWQLPPPTTARSQSLLGVELVVAAPILDRNGEVIAALYGDRRHDSPSASQPISKVEAMLVQLLASGVAAGLARLEQERVALASRIQFEQFFTPELSRQLAAHPDLLQGRDCEVTLLFCDIRGFSRISERLGPARTVEWVGDVMELLSECVIAQRGVLVDYIGDELLAMWGAPEEQPGHACHACRAALEMLAQLPQLNDRWQSVLGEPLDLGIGVNTGTARVGNTGSRRKFKYGPLGNTVNLASRIQGATKYLKARLLASDTTQRRLDHTFARRRLCTVELIGIAETVNLYELVPAGQIDWPGLQVGYEKALEEFEKRNYRVAARLLGNLLNDYPEDGPALLLMSRVIRHLVDEPVPFTAVWKLPGK